MPFKNYNGSRAERFKTELPDTLTPLDIANANSFVKKLMDKPTSLLGVAITTIPTRFPDLKAQGPSPQQYEIPTFLDNLNGRVTSTHPTFESTPTTSQVISKNPGPGYELNYAIGRHVANDYQFSTRKSGLLLERQERNRKEIDDLKHTLERDDLFTDKRACRRMAHFALYF